MATSSSSDQLKIVTWNVNGLGNKLDQVKKYLDDVKADICFLQEIKNKEEIEFSNYTEYVSPPSMDHRVAILIKKTLPFKVVEKTSSYKGSYLLRGLYDKKTMTLVNIYRPEYDETSFEEVFEDLKYSENVIIGGDFNVVINPSLDRTTGEQRYVKASKMIRKYMSEYGLCDSWRMTHPKAREYTHHDKGHNTSSRIDYFLIHKSLMRKIETEICKCNISDHHPVTCERDITDDPQGKCKCSDKDHCPVTCECKIRNHPVTCERDISDHHPVILTLDTENLSNKWEYYELKSPQNNLSFSELEKKLKSTVNKNSSTKKLVLWETLRNEIIKTHSVQLDFNESEKRIIPSIQTSNGKTTQDHEEINKTFQSFYKELYSTEQSAENMRENLPTLSAEESAALEEPFTETEVSNALEVLKNSSYKNEAKYFKHLWPILSPVFMELLKELKDRKTLPDYMRETLIEVQLEPSKEPTDPSSYRLLHKMEIEVMIITTVLANRLKQVLPTLTMNLIKEQEYRLEKVDRTKLYKTLEVCGFGKNFRNWIERIYSHSKARVRTNAITSGYFPLQRGLRQGCPLSPLLLIFT